MSKRIEDSPTVTTWGSRSKETDSTTLLAVAAVLSAVCSNAIFSRQSESYSEILSWILLPLLLKPSGQTNANSKPPFSNISTKPTSAWSLWAVSAGLAVLSLYRAELGMAKPMALLTPLVLAAQKHVSPESSVLSATQSPFFSPLVNTIWGSSLAAVFITYVLSYEDVLRLALSILAILIWFFVYIALVPKHRKVSQLLPHLNNIQEDVRPLSKRLVFLLVVMFGIQTALFGFVRSNVLLTLLSGLAKASSWYFIIQLAERATWCIATVIGTFGFVSTINPSMQLTGNQTILNLVASLLVLGQMIHMLPVQAKKRSMLWLLIAIPLIPYLWNAYAIISAQSLAQSSFATHQKHHPIQLLTDRARESFSDILSTQSKTYPAAYEEYQARYELDPPPGFEAWYRFAASHQSPIIDEFDTIFHSISPFLKLSGEEVQDMMLAVQSSPDSEVWLCGLPTNSAKVHCTHRWRSYDRHISYLFDRLLGDQDIKLPGLHFLVNHLDEPRVLTTPRLSDGTEVVGNKIINITNLSHQPAWDAITKHCSVGNRSRGSPASSEVETYGLPFITDSVRAMNLCQHEEYSNMNGFLLSPTSLRLIEGTVPVLSTGTLSTMGDILYPSPAYIEDEFLYDDKHDIAWAKKSNKLYWAGSTSGSFAADNQWNKHHRQRFVKLAQNLERQPHQYLRERGGTVETIKSYFLNSRLFDVAFTRIFQCERKYCHAQRTYFNTKGWADKDEALKSRLVFDLDGNGISGRYYKLLASKSCPLKQTLFREWHDDRLVPWLHYIPVSQSMDELPELVTYLTQTQKGQEIAKEVADRGREWYKKSFREVDMTIYVYRLLLELTRLQDPKRKAMPWI